MDSFIFYYNRTVIYLLRTWLTEPGILPKTQTNVIIDKVVPNESISFWYL